MIYLSLATWGELFSALVRKQTLCNFLAFTFALFEYTRAERVNKNAIYSFAEFRSIRCCCKYTFNMINLIMILIYW